MIAITCQHGEKQQPLRKREKQEFILGIFISWEPKSGIETHRETADLNIVLGTMAHCRISGSRTEQPSHSRALTSSVHEDGFVHGGRTTKRPSVKVGLEITKLSGLMNTQSHPTNGRTIKARRAGAWYIYFLIRYCKTRQRHCDVTNILCHSKSSSCQSSFKIRYSKQNA
uniref:Uncharacterized protein n=1 Tax=Schistocephalus solidus TaxID=70667 RepID=A0A0V0J310_SCHSO